MQCPVCTSRSFSFYDSSNVFFDTDLFSYSKSSKHLVLRQSTITILPSDSSFIRCRNCGTMFPIESIALHLRSFKFTPLEELSEDTISGEVYYKPATNEEDTSHENLSEDTTSNEEDTPLIDLSEYNKENSS